MFCIHIYTNRPSKERFNGCELFFVSAVHPPNPKLLFNLMKHFFTLVAAAMTFMVSGWSQTVVDIVVDSEDHTVLEAAVVEAGLVETLQGDGPFTVFAPTDAAFTTLLTALNVEAADLLGLPQLGDILTYHVAGVEAMSSDLSDGQMVTTVNGQDVTISIMGETVMINGSATVTVANIDATNGVVHVIDAVLVPATINGCTDMMACNYSTEGIEDNTVCSYIAQYDIVGSTDPYSQTLQVYTYTSTAGSTYEWTIVGGDILEGNGTNELSVVWNVGGAGSVCVTETNADGCAGEQECLIVDVNLSSVSEMLDGTLELFPVPTVENLHLVWTGPTLDNAFVTLRDAAGRVVKLQQVGERDVLDIGALSAGSYMLEFTVPARGSIQRRIMIQ